MRTAFPALTCLATLLACSRPEVGPAETTPSASLSSVSSESSVAAVAPSASWDRGKGEPVRVSIKASKLGFEPEVAEFIQGRPAILEFERVDDTSCVNAVRMPWAEEAQDLPLNTKVAIQIPDTSQDGEFQYGCWMNMVFGKVVIKPASGG